MIEGITPNEETHLSAESTDCTADGKVTRSRKERILREVRTHPFGYTVLVIFVVSGPLLAPFVFPQAPPAAAVAGGLAFGIYAALCAVPQKFL